MFVRQNGCCLSLPTKSQDCISHVAYPNKNTRKGILGIYIILAKLAYHKSISHGFHESINGSVPNSLGVKQIPGLDL